jgi:hypothetical protein
MAYIKSGYAKLDSTVSNSCYSSGNSGIPLSSCTSNQKFLTICNKNYIKNKCMMLPPGGPSTESFSTFSKREMNSCSKDTNLEHINEEINEEEDEYELGKMNGRR